MKEADFSNLEKMYLRLGAKLKASNTESTYLNMGYWKDTNNIIKASEALINLVVEKAEIKNGHKVLDLGFGYGDQDIYIANKFVDTKIYGLNILPKQVNEAIKKVELAGLANRIILDEGDAVNLPFENDTFDVVIAIEAAFHFNTRQRFFRESYRVLKAGGVICLADCLPSKFAQMDNQFLSASLNMGIPIENQYGIEKYTELLGLSGFSDVSVDDLSEFVLAHSAVEMLQSNGWRSKSEIDISAETDISNKIKKFTEATTIGGYYLISAIKQ